MAAAAPFKIGQFRRSQTEDYTTAVSYTIKEKLQDTDLVDFYDPMMSFTGGESISSLQSYYLAFSVQQRTDAEQKFTIKLEHSSMMEEDEQFIRTFVVPIGTETTNFELIFNPNAIYDQLVFELRRENLDFTTYSEQGYNGRFLNITISRFDAIIDIVENQLKKKYTIKNGLKKIGIQGPPGLLFVLNGEEMHIGRTGIYELYYDDVTIKTLGFILKDSLVTQDGKDYFILDFKYY